VHDALLVDVVPASDGEPEVRLFAYGLLEATDEQLDLLGLSREDVATRLPAGTDDTVLGYSQGLFYAGDCWASGAGSDWRQSPPNSGDWDFHSLFKVSNTKPYWVYASVALWAYLAATHKPLLWGRDPGLNRVWVNLGSYGYLAQYSAWVRSTNPCL
jgi:hypothetical protein